MFLGFPAFGPYFIAREYAPDVGRDELKSFFSKVLESRFVHLPNVLYALFVYAFVFGAFTPGSEQFHDAMFYGAAVDFSRLFSSDRSVAVSTIDTIVLSIAMWWPLREDMTRRGWFRKGNVTDSIFTALSILAAPGLGPALYLFLRPRLPEHNKPKS